MPKEEESADDVEQSVSEVVPSGADLIDALDGNPSKDDDEEVDLAAAVVPANIAELVEDQAADDDFRKIVSFLKDPESVTDTTERKRAAARAEQFALREDGVLLYKAYDEVLEQDRLVVALPKKHRAAALGIFHSSPWGGHVGGSKLYERLRRAVYWPRMFKHCKAWARSCIVCRRSKQTALPGVGYLHPQFVVRPMDRVCADLITCLPPSDKDGFECLLVMIDAHSTWTELIPIRSKSKRDVAIGIVNGWIMRHDCFLSLLTDQGKEFHNEVLDEVCRILRVKKLTSTGYRPQTNGLCERQNRAINQTVRIFLRKVTTNRWPELLPAVQHALNTAPRDGSGLSAFQMLYGRQPRTPLEMFWSPNGMHGAPATVEDYEKLKRLLSITRDRVNLIRGELAKRMKLCHDTTHRPVEFKVRTAESPGSMVLYHRRSSREENADASKTKWSFGWHGPFEVLQKLSSVLYKIAPIKDDGSHGPAWKAHVQHLAPCPAWSANDPDLVGLDLSEITGPNDMSLDTDPSPWFSERSDRNIHEKNQWTKHRKKHHPSNKLWEKVSGFEKGQLLIVRDRFGHSKVPWRVARVHESPPPSGLYVKVQLYSPSRSTVHRAPDHWEWLRIYVDPDGKEIGASFDPGRRFLPLVTEVPAIDVITEIHRLRNKKIEPHVVVQLRKDGWVRDQAVCNVSVLPTGPTEVHLALRRGEQTLAFEHLGEDGFYHWKLPASTMCTSGCAYPKILEDALAKVGIDSASLPWRLEFELLCDHRGSGDILVVRVPVKADLENFVREILRRRPVALRQAAPDCKLFAISDAPPKLQNLLRRS